MYLPPSAIRILNGKLNRHQTTAIPNCGDQGKDESKKRPRTEYTLEEDKAIIQIIQSCDDDCEFGPLCYKGDRFWKQPCFTEHDLVGEPRRSFGSLKGRFTKQILPQLDSYFAKETEIDQFKIRLGIDLIGVSGGDLVEPSKGIKSPRDTFRKAVVGVDKCRGSGNLTWSQKSTTVAGNSVKDEERDSSGVQLCLSRYSGDHVVPHNRKSLKKAQIFSSTEERVQPGPTVSKVQQKTRNDGAKESEEIDGASIGVEPLNPEIRIQREKFKPDGGVNMARVAYNVTLSQKATTGISNSVDGEGRDSSGIQLRDSRLCSTTYDEVAPAKKFMRGLEFVRNSDDACDGNVHVESTLSTITDESDKESDEVRVEESAPGNDACSDSRIDTNERVKHNHGLSYQVKENQLLQQANVEVIGLEDESDKKPNSSRSVVEKKRVHKKNTSCEKNLLRSSIDQVRKPDTGLDSVKKRTCSLNVARKGMAMKFLDRIMSHLGGENKEANDLAEATAMHLAQTNRHLDLILNERS